MTCAEICKSASRLRCRRLYKKNIIFPASLGAGFFCGFVTAFRYPAEAADVGGNGIVCSFPLGWKNSNRKAIGCYGFEKETKSPVKMVAQKVGF